ncbi:hypothetical protein DH2020_007797 [Rehmannia glutinosa]|uniref:Uncharacterized protein n=1 Tax=Rehmannia glutinosa TaxID=99300 RepID=A0ABR0TZ63_REHGL
MVSSAKRHIQLEEAAKPESNNKKKAREDDKNLPRKSDQREGGRRDHESHLTPLNAPLAEVLIAAQKQNKYTLIERSFALCEVDKVIESSSTLNEATHPCREASRSVRRTKSTVVAPRFVRKHTSLEKLHVP